MRKILILLLIGALFAGFTSLIGLSDDEREGIVVGTWNIRGYPEKTVARRELLSQTLGIVDLSILCVQEIGNQDDVNNFLATETWFSKAAFQNSSDKQDNAIFFAPYVKMVDIPDPGGFLHPAQAAYFKYDGLDAVIITVHLAWNDRLQRAKERQLLACVARKALEIDPDVIIAGDFNTTGEPGDTIEELATAIGFEALPNDRPTTYSGAQYDYILVSQDLATEEAAGQSSLVLPTTKMEQGKEDTYEGISDHRMVLTVFLSDSTYSDCESWPPDLSQFHWDCPAKNQLTPPPPGNNTPPVPGKVVINEVEANPSGTDTGNEWVELYNTGTTAVNISGWSIIGTHGRPATVIIPYGTIIQPHQFLVFYRTKQWLDNKGEIVLLRDSMGDVVDRTPTLNDTSDDALTWCRVPDGTGNWVRQPGTKGYSNDSG